MVSLDYIRDLLDLLKDKNVHSCQIGNFTVVFNETETNFTATEAKSTIDDGHSTSNKRVDGFRHPSLYPWQGGKVLKFDGSME